MERRTAHFIYVIIEPDTGFAKIGRGQNPFARLACLQTGNPRKLAVVFQREMPNREMAEQAEYRAHGSLIKWRVSGEWFVVPTEIAVQEANKACNFVHNHRAGLSPQSRYLHRRDLGFDYKAILADEMASEVEEGHDLH